MSARFTEECRSNNYLKLIKDELIVQVRAQDTPPCYTCEEDIFLGFFFDGTNNNKYRDTLDFSHSNVARLYEAFAGMGTMKELAVPGSPRAPKADESYLSLKTPNIDPKLYRKTYIPGVGTPFKELGDTGLDLDKTGGLAAAWHGEVRICWALLQVTNHISAALYGENLNDPLQDDGRIAQRMLDYWSGPKKPLPPTIKVRPYQSTPEQWQEIENPELDRTTVLSNRSAALKKKIVVRLANKPSLRRVRVSVFGFSRGAAEARVFTNWLLNAYGGGVGGIDLSVDFLGLFDTVASVGLAHSSPGSDGHYAWANEGNLKVSSAVKRCVHLVAAHEVRASFPLDLIGSGGNCKEVVYPGVHSDIGGGYPPNDQGRAAGQGVAGDSKKISQITLAQMYREALMAGVPMTEPSNWKGFRLSNFQIDSTTIQKFNAYVKATSAAPAPSKKPSAKELIANANTMWPTEQQPAAPVRKIMRQHYGYFLQWRRSLLGNAHLQTALQSSTAPTKAQDILDIKTTNALLKKELDFVLDDSVSKYLNSGDTTIEKLLATVGVSEAIPLLPVPKGASLLARAAVVNVMRDKQKEWDGGIKTAWAGNCPAECLEFFETIMHDSRAWFKPFDSDPQDANKAEVAKLTQENATLEKNSAALKALDPSMRSRAGLSEQQINDTVKANNAKISANSKAISEYKAGTRTQLIFAGHEPYRMYGYLRWRHVYGV